MVIRKDLEVKFALISVFNKDGLKKLCHGLDEYNYKFISTGSTAKVIKSYGYECFEISKLTKFKEILDGRVKTLNPKLYGSILFRRESKKDLKEFKKLDFPKIDIVIVNLYPFTKFKNSNDKNKTIEMIDIGGPTLLRAASKNYQYTTPIIDINDYKTLIINIKKNDGETDIIYRKKMAGKVFKLISNYDNQINKWFENNKKINAKKIKMRYGENPNQKAFFLPKDKNSIFNFQIHGKQISYNNIIDVDSGYKCLKEFGKPTCVIIKHTNPCGVASANSINLAFQKAFRCDMKSAFGGIVLLNRNVDKNLANSISKIFFEIIVATNFSESALNILKRKKNLIILKINNIKLNSEEFRETIFGVIKQEINDKKINKNFIKLVSKIKPSNKIIDDLIFSLKVVKHMKSNAIVLSKNSQTIGLGSGQTNRVDALKSAIKKMKKNSNIKNFVCASDGFFPFNDSISLLAKNNCSVIAQPSGSLNDTNSIKFAIKNKISLYFIKFRLFKH